MIAKKDTHVRVRPIANGDGSEDRVLLALEEYSRRVEAGQPVSRESILAKYSDVADELSNCLDSLEFIREVAPQLNDDAVNGGSKVSEIRPSASIGDFQILRELGRGGMGVVYEAEQISLGRHVALKVLPFAAMLDKQQLARFKNEARAAATLDHPNIVAIYSVGSERGVHYYAMQLIEGQSLAEIVADMVPGRLPSPEDTAEAADLTKNPAAVDTAKAALPTVRAKDGVAFSTLLSFDSREYYRTIVRLGIQAAEALDHAHQNGILHRDIKPANLLLDDEGKLWITDFGLARIEQDAGMTMTGDLLGTLRYMSSEQALAKRIVIDHRTDIYSLGVTLYELVTLQPAFAGEDRQQLLHRIAFDEPRPPRQVNARIPQDVQTIISKAIEKNPADRYATAKEFGDDLRRFLDHQPIKARPASYFHQLMKWSRRHIAIVWSALAASLLAIVLLGVSTMLVAESRNDANVQRVIATHERDKAVDQRNLAVEERNNARLNQYYAEIVSGQTDLQQGNIARLHQKLIRHLPYDGESDHRGWEWYYLFSCCHPEVRSLYHPGYPGFLLVASWSPDGKFIATDGAIWKAESGECVRLFTPALATTKDVAWSHDSQNLAWNVASDTDGIYIWDRRTDSVRTLRRDASDVAHLAFSPKGKQLASSGGDHAVKIWDLATGTVVRTLSADQNTSDVDWSPDGELLAAGVGEGGVHVWSVATGKIVARREEDPTQHDVCLSWRPDGRQLAVTTAGHWYILDRRDWKPLVQHDHPFGNGGNGGSSAAGGIQWNPSGTQLAIAQGNAVTLWDPATDHPLRTLAGHINPVKSVCWSPDGRQLVTTDTDREIKVWDLQRSPQPAAITAGEPLQRLSWESDSNTLVSVAAADLSSSHWSATDGKRIKIVKAAEVKKEGAGILSPDRRSVARLSGTDKKRTITVRDNETGAVQSIWRVEEPFALLTYRWWPDESQLNFAWSPDGSKLAIPFASDTEEGLEIWDSVQEKSISRWVRHQILKQNWDLQNPTWSPDGTRVAIIGLGDDGDGGAEAWSSHVHVIDVATGKRILKRLLRDRAQTGGAITELGWCADGRLLALATTQGLIEVFDAETGQGTMNCRAHDTGIHALAWSPDGSRLATAAPDGIVKLIERRGGGELLSLRMPQSAAALLAWSPDGKRLAAADNKGTIQLWDASRGYEIAAGGSRRGDLAWAYYQLADELTGKAADAALRMSLEMAPKSLDYRSLRGPTLVRLGQFEAAANEFGAAVPAVQPEFGAVFAIWQAYALLGASDMDAYRDLCKRLVEAAKASKVPSLRFDGGWLGALIPDAVDGFEDDVKQFRDDLAKTASEGKRGLESEDNFTVLRYGAMLYRLGHYDDAVDALMTLTARFAKGSDKRNQYMCACAQYFLAMARYQLGHKFQARRLLDQARATSDALHNDPSVPWFQPVVLNALQREAKGLIEP